MSDKLVENLVIKGDISEFTPAERVQYYQAMCNSLGLNPITKPFDIMTLQGKTVLYCNKEGSLQLSKLNGISIVDMVQTFEKDLCITKVKVQDKTGRFDMATGAVNIKNLQGDGLANGIMKSETKAKRRAILSISGLGALDETEIETIPGASRINPEIKNIASTASESAHDGQNNGEGQRKASQSIETALFGHSDKKDSVNTEAQSYLLDLVNKNLITSKQISDIIFGVTGKHQKFNEVIDSDMTDKIISEAEIMADKHSSGISIFTRENL